MKRGSNVSKRVFNQKFDLPAGAEVDKITSEYKLDGKLIVSVPAASQQAAGKTISFRTSEMKILITMLCSFHLPEFLQLLNEKINFKSL